VTRTSYSISLVGSIILLKPNITFREEEDPANGLTVPTSTRVKTRTEETLQIQEAVVIETRGKEVADTIEETDKAIRRNMLTMMIRRTTRVGRIPNSKVIETLLITVISSIE